jgi:superfamily II DNA or RNA helicase
MNESLINSLLAGTTLQARPYQGRIVNKTFDMFQGQYVNPQTKDREPAVGSVLIESPCGSGKTPMGLLTAKALQQREPDLVVAWFAMRHNLLEQARYENEHKRIGLRNFFPVSMFDKHPDELLRVIHGGSTPRPVLLVTDEARHDAAASMTSQGNVIQPKYRLGLDATPFRTDRLKLCYEKVVKDAGISTLIRDGWLSRYDHYSIDSWTPESVCETYLREPERWGQTFMYFHNQKQCAQVMDALTAANISCDLVTGDTDCEQQLDKFRAQETRVLVSMMKLTEGCDMPSLQTAFVRDSCKGPTIQMGGRLFRLFDGLPVKQMVQSKNTHWPFLRTAMPDQQFVWQGSRWASLTINPRIDSVAAITRQAIAQANVKLPKYLTGRKKRQKMAKVGYED